jgi:replicative DNA helicase
MRHPEKIAPSSVEAEEAVLGSVLISPDALYEVASFLESEDFFIVRNSWVWDALLALHRRGDAIDSLTVIEELKKRGQLLDLGGSAYITYLINNTPTHVHAETYARIVERAAIRRRLLAAAADIAQTALEEDAEVGEIVDRAEATLYGVTERRVSRHLITMAEASSRFYDRVEKLAEHPGQTLGLPTTYHELDHIIGGLAESTLTIVAARPGVGKTSLLLNIAQNVMKTTGARVALFSLEMTETQLMQRFMAAETGIDSQKIKAGTLEAGEWALFTAATERAAALKLWIDDTPKVSLMQIRNKCRKLERTEGLDLVIVDYLQLMKPERANDNREQEVSELSRGLKELAREFKVPFLVAAQLNRALEARADKRPKLSDLRESGSIEADADVVMFIYRDDLVNDKSTRFNQADIMVAKNRDGRTGVATLYVKNELTRFSNMERRTIDFGSYGGSA